MNLYKMPHIQGGIYDSQNHFRNTVSRNSKVGNRRYCYSDFQMKKTEDGNVFKAKQMAKLCFKPTEPADSKRQPGAVQ